MIVPVYLVYVCGLLVQGKSFSAEWSEPYSWQSARCTLNVRGGQALRAELLVRLGSETRRTVREDSSTGRSKTDWGLAIPIAVRNEARPQILAKVYRSDWLDFVILGIDGSVGSGNLLRIFSFSCRDEHAIRWHSEHGRLVSFETYDRYEPVPKRLQSISVPGRPWQKVTRYLYDVRTHRWTAAKSAWKPYKFGDSPPGQFLRTAKECGFAFVSRTGRK